MNFKFSVTLSSTFVTQAPTLEVLLDGVVVSSTLVTTLSTNGTSVYDFDLSYEGSFPLFELRFNDSSNEADRRIRVEDIRVNGQEIDPALVALAGDASSNANAVFLNSNGDSTNVTSLVQDYMLGTTEPMAPDAASQTHTGTAANDGALKGSQNHDVIYGDAGKDKISGLNGDDFIHGGDDNDTLYGHDGNDVLVGGEGNDILGGRNDDDILYGGNGHDKLEGDAGNDILNGGAGDDNMWAGTEDDIAYGGDGKDRIRGEEGNDTLYGDAGNDTLYGGEGDDVLNGGDDKDWLYAGDGNDTLNGDEGTDRLFGEAGDDTLNGGTGQDILLGGDGNDIVNGGDQKDWLYGDAGNDIVSGGAGKDRAYGGDGDDTIYGDGGDDILWGDAGNDTLEGGQGDDVLYATLDGVYTQAITVATVLAANSGVYYNATTNNFYQHVTTGGADTTYAQAVADAATNNIHGVAAHLATLSNSAEQTFVGSVINGGLYAWVDGTDAAAEGTFVHESGPESGTTLDASLNWYNGSIAGTNNGTADNVLIWDGGGDTLYAYAGTNSVYGYIAEWEGADILTAGGYESGHDSTGEVNTLLGGEGDDTIYGSMGADILNGGTDNDTLDGGAGVDVATYENATGSVTVDLGTGTSSGADGVDSLISIENIKGSDFDDNLTGDAAVNVIHGGAGNDTILGGGGNDVLRGEGGNDVLGASSVSNNLTVADVLASNSNLSYSADTGNFYQFVSTTANWTTANTTAQGMTINGTAGHLVTINSAAEQAFISTVAASSSHFWSGGTDSGTEGVWQWTEGAEAGTTFWNSSGSTGEHTNWYNGDDTSNSSTNDHLLILNNGTYSNQWYAYTSTYSAAYLVEWEGADVLSSGILSNSTTNTVSLYGGDGLDTLYGGAGIDSFVFEAANAFNDIDVIENFVSGAGGDILDLSDLLSGASGSVTDLVQFVDDGGNTLVQVDVDGSANGANFTTVAQINGQVGLDEAALHADGNIII